MNDDFAMKIKKTHKFPKMTKSSSKVLGKFSTIKSITGR
jgi:hypothetical protein